jgi:hypothetical protein
MPIMPEVEITNRESSLIKAMENLLPDFARLCREENDEVVLHQDAFAADYQEDEYKLLGMAIKFAGLCGREVRIIGKNRGTLKQPRIH